MTNDELTTTAQSKTLNDNLGIKIIDRTQLILEIFALRARSREVNYKLISSTRLLTPRLQGHGKFISFRELVRVVPETKLEMDRRHIRTRMNEIKHQLKQWSNIERYRNQREQNQVFQIALIGYTNAGKSSWFNVLANETTLEKIYHLPHLTLKHDKYKLTMGLI